jgi:hypothetical protein
MLNSKNSATHVYRHAGEYEAVVTATKDGLASEAPVRVIVSDTRLQLNLEENDTTAHIENVGDTSFEMTGVRLENSSGQTYIFPDKTRILPHQALFLQLADLAFSDMVRPREITLISALGTLRITARGSVGGALQNGGEVQSLSGTYGSRVPMTVLGVGSRVDVPALRPSVAVAPAQAKEMAQTNTPRTVEVPAPQAKKPLMARLPAPQTKKSTPLVDTPQAVAKEVDKHVAVQIAAALDALPPETSSWFARAVGSLFW